MPANRNNKLGFVILLVLGASFAVLGGCDQEPDRESDPSVESVPPIEAPMDAPSAPPPVTPAEEVQPRLNSIFPNRGTRSGGTVIRIVGREFVSGMQVRIGFRGCRALEVSSESHLRCETPPSDILGPTDVVVEWPDGNGEETLAGAFSYYEPVVLEAVEPRRGPASGGYPVVLRGTGFVDGSVVTFGDQRAVVEEVSDDTRSAIVRCPEGEPGTADITVRNINGEYTLADGFLWYEELFVESILPAWGWLPGGEEVILTGVGLGLGTSIFFGENRAAVVESSLGRQFLKVIAPVGRNPGPVDLRVENGSDTWVEESGYLYVSPEEMAWGVDGVSPSRLPTDARQAFLVGGTGFTDATEVLVEGEPVVCVREHAQLLRCIPPVVEPGIVDVTVRQGNAEVFLRDALTFYRRVELYDIQPRRGSVAGGTLVEIRGEGFYEGMSLTLEGERLEVEYFESEQSVFARTPPGPMGWVSLRLEGDDDVSILPQAYEYFDPASTFGGIWGDAIQSSVNVTVLDAMSGTPLGGATVVVIGLLEPGRWVGQTDAQGQVTIADPDLRLPVSVTVALEGYTTTTFERLTAENTTALLMPLEPPSSMGEATPLEPVILSGDLFGLNEQVKPDEEGMILVAFVETTHESPGSRLGNPPPQPNGILTEDGPFQIQVPPGELAIVATAGYVPADLLTGYEQGQVPFWSFRDSLIPIGMGLRRFITAAPGDEIDSLQVHLDIPLNLDVEVRLLNPSGGVPGAPDLFLARPILSLGADGYFDFRVEKTSSQPTIRIPALPDLSLWPDPDVVMYWEGEAEQSDPLQPYRTSWAKTEARDMRTGVDIGPFLGTTELIEPRSGGRLSAFRWVEWVTHPGIDGPDSPTEPPDIHLVRVSTESQVVWTHVVPGAVNRFQFPQLPLSDETISFSDLPAGNMQLSVYSLSIQGDFSFDDFTFQDLGRVNSYSWSYVLFTR